MYNALGLIEFSSIASGYLATDTMLKAAHVELVVARTICPGKFMAIIKGEVAAVSAGIEAAVNSAEGALVDDFVIPNIHDSVFPALAGTNQVSNIEALGVLETFSAASTIEAADAIVKAANVRLIDVRLAMAIGGKGFTVFTGEVAAVNASLEAGVSIVSEKGLLVNKIIIPAPAQEFKKELI